MPTSKPKVVRLSTKATTKQMPTRANSPAWRTGWLSTSSGNTAVSEMGSVRGTVLSVARGTTGSRELTIQRTPNSTREFNMMVLITSWAPVLARSTPGTPPQKAPPKVPAMRISGMATMPGRSDIHDSAPT